MTVRDNAGIALACGCLGALLLGMLLVPLRELTPAANLAFVFVALTIGVAEWGGRGAGEATALVSALRRDFFLTRPYGRPTFAQQYDGFAFAGLAGCGLIAAAFGSRREGTTRARQHLALLHAALRRLEKAGPAEPALAASIDDARGLLPVSALVVRDAGGEVLVSTA